MFSRCTSPPHQIQNKKLNKKWKLPISVERVQSASPLQRSHAKDTNQRPRRWAAGKWYPNHNRAACAAPIREIYARKMRIHKNRVAHWWKTIPLPHSIRVLDFCKFHIMSNDIDDTPADLTLLMNFIYFCRRRQNRLSSVRSIFYECYCKTIGFKYKNGDESSFGSMLGNFAERVGFTQRPM